MRRGFTLGEILLVSTLVTSISLTTYHAIRKGKEAQCLNNLRQIYMAVRMFEMDHGCLPSAKFFPSSPSDPKGIHNILKDYGANRNIFFCPALPEQLNKYGTNYIWNDNVNGKDLSSLPSSTWLMTEMTAVSKRIPPPHGWGFGILYIDGHAEIGKRIKFPEVSSSKKPSPPDTSGSPKEKPFKIDFQISSPAIKAGESARITVYFTDKNGNYCKVKEGNLKIEISDEKAKFPQSIDLSQKGGSRLSFNITFFKAGLHTIRISHPLKGIEIEKSIRVSPGKAEKFLIPDFPESFVAGKVQRVKIISVDKWGNISDYKGECFLWDEKRLLALKKVDFDKGIFEDDIVFNKSVEEDRLLLYDKEKVIFSSPPFSVVPSSPEKIIISGVPVSTAGEKINIEISPVDRFGNICENFAGKLKMEISDEKGKFPSEISFDKKDKGRKIVGITFYTSGNHKIKVYNKNLKGEKEIFILPGELDHFSIEKIDTQIAGKPFTVLIRAEDKWGNRVKGFKLKDLTGSVNYTQQDVTSGMWLETIVIKKASKKNMIIIDDGAGHIGKSNIFEVKPSSPFKIALSGPSVLESGKDCEFQILIEDKYGNRIEKYSGEFKVLCDDEEAEIKIDKKKLKLSVKFKEEGIRNIKIFDKNNPSLHAEMKVLVLKGGKNEDRDNK